MLIIGFIALLVLGCYLLYISLSAALGVYYCLAMGLRAAILAPALFGVVSLAAGSSILWWALSHSPVVLTIIQP